MKSSHFFNCWMYIFRIFLELIIFFISDQIFSVNPFKLHIPIKYCVKILIIEDFSQNSSFLDSKNGFVTR